MLFILTFADEENRDKFEYLYTHYKNLLLQKAYCILKDYALAEDAVSEAYIRVYKNLHKVDDPTEGRTIAFLVTIVKNVSLSMWTSEKKRPVEDYDEDQADSFNLEEHTFAALGSQHIYTVVERLEEDLRGTFLLRYAYDCSTREIANLFHISESNVRVRLHRARKKLASLLTKEGYFV